MCGAATRGGGGSFLEGEESGGLANFASAAEDTAPTITSEQRKQRRRKEYYSYYVTPDCTNTFHPAKNAWTTPSIRRSYETRVHYLLTFPEMHNSDVSHLLGK